MNPTPRFVAFVLFCLASLGGLVLALLFVLSDGLAAFRTDGLFIMTLSSPVLFLLASMVLARSTSNFHRAKKWLGFHVLNCDLIPEEEAHGITSAD